MCFVSVKTTTLTKQPIPVILCGHQKPMFTNIDEVDRGGKFVDNWTWHFSLLNQVTHCGRDKMVPIFQMLFSNAFSWINENLWISIKISLKFVPKGPNNDIPALAQIMAWRWPGNKPLSEPMMVSLLTHKCVTRPQGVIIHYVYGWI